MLARALIDGELDAGHAREVEAHVAICPRCAAALRGLSPDEQGGAQRRRSALCRAAGAAPAHRGFAAAGSAGAEPARGAARLCDGIGGSPAIAASGLVRRRAAQRHDKIRIASEVVSAHLRSLQAGHLTDVLSTKPRTVKPWFNGRLDVAPPVIDLTALGFTLIGGRLDYIDARPVGAIVYRRRLHVINLFVAQTASTESRAARTETFQGFNVRSWSEGGLNYWAVSDIAADELAEFSEKFQRTMKTSAG